MRPKIFSRLISLDIFPVLNQGILCLMSLFLKPEILYSPLNTVSKRDVSVSENKLNPLLHNMMMLTTGIAMLTTLAILA